MAKRSAVDQLVERIVNDIAKRTDARMYAAKHGAVGSVLEGMDADIAELHRIRDYVVTGEPETAPAPKRKPRKKPGLPPAAHEQ